MARILFATMPIAGHVSPLVAVARALVERGHELVWYTGARYQALAESSGARPLPFAQARDFDDADFDNSFAGRQGLSGLAQLRYDLCHVFVDGIRGQVEDLARVASQLAPEVMVMDPGLIGGVLHAELTNIPNVVVGVVPLPCSSRDTAPFGAGLAPRAGWFGRARNAALHGLVQRVLFRNVQDRWTELRRAYGLAPTDWWMDVAIRNASLYLQPTIASFEYPRSDLPGNVRFIGPLPASSSLAAEEPAFWSELGGELPVVHVTQGTLANASPDLIAPALAGLANEPVLVVVATGGRDPASLGLGALPANARVARFLDYRRLLPRLSAMVTNGGYGGVQLALAHGVPLVVSGVTEDKAEVGARVAWSGAGLNLRRQRPRASDVRAAVRQVLATPSYRERAAELAAEYALHDALSEAVQQIEGVLRRPGSSPPERPRQPRGGERHPVAP